MLNLHWIEIFFRGIPEMLLMVWGIYVIARKSINMKIYILLSIIMAPLSFFVRMLPIYFGIHMFINVILIICIMVIVDIPMIKAIYSTVIMFLIFILSEFLNVIILNLFNLLNTNINMNISININTQLTDPIIKSIFGIPSLIIIYLFVITIRYFIKKKEELKNVTN